ncbi:hypothetical protein GCM10010442_11130 [Kitasatospora kifunensis]|uniref:Ferredoxin n=1 Tax=Kitasatospora kifunensis TaxID=58351 RepID=A0A7W7R7M0_KITKI|nr:ferredoxin [Kitasatospora kifunensis]
MGPGRRGLPVAGPLERLLRTIPLGNAEALVVRVDRARCVDTGWCAGGDPAELVLGKDGCARAPRKSTTDRKTVTDAATACLTEIIDDQSADASGKTARGPAGPPRGRHSRG